MLKGIQTLQSEIWSSPLLLLLFVMAVGYLIHRARREQKGNLTFLLVYSGLVTVLYLLNPILSYGVPRVTGDLYAFVRFAWLVPAFPLLAYAGARVISDLKQHRILLAAVICALIISGGSYLTEINVPAANAYKIDEEAKACSDIILAREGITDPVNAPGYIPVNVQLHDTNIAEDGSKSNVFYYGIRQYAKPFILSRTTLTATEYKKASFSYEDYFTNQCRYYICDKHDNITRELKKIGYELLGETKSHAVYENTYSYNLFLVRHGQTEANVQGQLVGHSESPLTKEGEETTKELGAALHGVSFTAAYASPAKRAIETAENILEASGQSDVDVEELYYLYDLNYGDAEGMTWEEIAATYGSDMDFAKIFGRAEDENYTSPIPEADSLNTYIQYVSSAMNEIATTGAVAGWKDANILVANHSGIRYWLERQLPGVAVPSGLDNAGLTILRFDRGVWEAITINDTDYAHLDEVLASMK